MDQIPLSNWVPACLSERGIGKKWEGKDRLAWPTEHQNSPTCFRVEGVSGICWSVVSRGRSISSSMQYSWLLFMLIVIRATLLHVLPPTSNITQLNFVVVSWTSVYFFNNLQQQNFVAWQCLRCVVIRATRFWTCNTTMLRWKLKKNVSRITRPLRGQQHGRAHIRKCQSCFVKKNCLDWKCCSWTKSVSSWLPLLAPASLVGPFRTDGVDPSFNQHHRFTSCHTVCLINQASGTLLRLKENFFFF